MSKIKLVLFDADGLVLNGQMFSVMLEEKYGITGEDVTPFFKGPFIKCKTDEADLKEELKPFLQKWGWKKSVEQFLSEWFEYEHKIDSNVIQFIQELRKKNIFCAMASNQEKYRAEYIRKNMDLEKEFDALFFSADIKQKKPDKDFFTYILNKANTKPEEVLFFDDSKENIDAANSLGMKGYFYTDFETMKSKIEEYIL